MWVMALINSFKVKFWVWGWLILLRTSAMWAGVTQNSASQGAGVKKIVMNALWGKHTLRKVDLMHCSCSSSSCSSPLLDLLLCTSKFFKLCILNRKIDTTIWNNCWQLLLLAKRVSFLYTEICPLPLLTRDGWESDKEAERAKLSDKKWIGTLGSSMEKGRAWTPVKWCWGRSYGETCLKRSQCL